MFYHPVDISGGEEDLAENLDGDRIKKVHLVRFKAAVTHPI